MDNLKSDLERVRALALALDKACGAAEGIPARDRLEKAAAELIRTHGEALAGMVDDAMKWRECNGEYTHPDSGEVMKCHVNVGTNLWHDGTWCGYEEISPDELRQVIQAMQESRDE